MKHLHLKTLLVAAALCVGSSAWATVTPFTESYSSTSTTTGWSTGTSGRFTPVILSENDNYFLSVNQSERNNNGATVTGTVISGKAAAGDDFTLLFDMRLSSSSNQANTEFIIKDATNSGNILSLKETGTWATTWTLNGTSTQIELPNSNKANESNTIADVTWCSYKITRSGEFTYLTITNKETSAVIFARAIISGSSATGGLGNIQFLSSRYNANFAIDNIVVREVESGDVPVATPTTYTVKFQDGEGTTLKSDVVINTIEGATVNANDYVASFIEGGKKYLYVSGNDPITAEADPESNIITLVFREAATYSYTVNAIDDESNVLKQLASTTGFEGDVLSFAYPAYVLKDGALWNCGATSSTYKKYFTLTEDNQVFTITYASTDIDNIVYYAEAEDVAGMTAYRAGNADARSSQAAMGYAAEDDVVFTSLPAGKYQLTFVQYKSTSGDGTQTFEVGSNSFAQTTASNNWSSRTFDEFTIFTTTDVVLKAGGNTNLGVDFVYIKKTGDVRGDAYTLAADEAKKLTFNNATTGTKNWDNWLIDVYADGVQVGNVRADWWDEVDGSNANYTYGYSYSSDGGATPDNSNWTSTFKSDMADADVELTLSYTGGVFYVSGTATHEQKVYYYGYKKTGLSASSITFTLFGNNATLTEINATSASITTAPAHPTAISTTIGTTGYSTFTSTLYPLDLSTISGAEAYYASAVGASDVTLTSTTATVSSGVGLILKGEASATATIDIADAGSIIDGNLLVGCTASTPLDANASYYVLVSNEGTAEFQQLDKSGATIPAGKAYLDATGAGARSLNIVFADEATGISSMHNSESIMHNEVFNLNGQRVAAPQKGLYIVNGKKVIVK